MVFDYIPEEDWRWSSLVPTDPAECGIEEILNEDGESIEVSDDEFDKILEHGYHYGEHHWREWIDREPMFDEDDWYNY